MATTQTVNNSYVEANGVSYAYRILGPEIASTPPLLLLQFFRASIDFWDPLLVSIVTKTRRVILLDNAGVGHSTGEIPDSIPEMARHVTTFINALGLKQIDILGFSLGGMVAQQVALDSSSAGTNLVRKLIVSASSPGRGPHGGGEGIVDGDGATTNKLAGTPETSEEAFLKLFFYDSDTSRAAGRGWFKRIHERTEETSGEERKGEVQGMGSMKQGIAMGKWAGGEGSYDVLDQIEIPVLVTNGKKDFMLPTVNSYVMSQRLPNAKLIIFPDSGHGHCFQWAEQYAVHVNQFLDG